MDKEIMKRVAEQYKECILHPYNEIINIIGFEGLCVFVQEFEGVNIYVPSLRTILKDCIKQDITERHKEKNIRELARSYGFSEQYVRNIIRYK